MRNGNSCCYFFDDIETGRVLWFLTMNLDNSPFRFTLFCDIRQKKIVKLLKSLVNIHFPHLFCRCRGTISAFNANTGRDPQHRQPCGDH